VSSLFAVFTHEWRRSMTAGRIVWWILMSLFPISVALVIRTRPDFENNIPPQARDTFWAVFLYVMVPCICSALGVLLTAGPAVATELEQRSWVYMATRPNGILWLLLGKFLVAFTWGFSAAVVALTGAILISNAESRGHIWGTMISLSALSCLAYSAAFLLVGAIFPKRAMVFSVMYATVVEVVLGFIPALVNRLTVQFRLRSLMVQWLPSDENLREAQSFDYVFGDDSSSVHVIWLLGLTVGYLLLAQVIVHMKEFTTATEGDL
jgi:ABC-type transport system involved in multi-copper enzyme maturation permease subunit